jgi:MoaD family protein
LKVSVRFFAALREIVGKKEETLQFPEDKDVTIEKVLKRLTALHGKDFVEYVYDAQTGEVRGYLHLLVNEKNMKGLKAQLKDGDVLAIIPPVGGG